MSAPGPSSDVNYSSRLLHMLGKQKGWPSSASHCCWNLLTPWPRFLLKARACGSGRQKQRGQSGCTAPPLEACLTQQALPPGFLAGRQATPGAPQLEAVGPLALLQHPAHASRFLLYTQKQNCWQMWCCHSTVWALQLCRPKRWNRRKCGMGQPTVPLASRCRGS